MERASLLLVGEVRRSRAGGEHPRTDGSVVDRGSPVGRRLSPRGRGAHHRAGRSDRRL